MINRNIHVSINCLFMHRMNPTLYFPVAVSIGMLLVIKKLLHIIVLCTTLFISTVNK